MKFSEQSNASIVACINEAVSRYQKSDEMDEMVTDIHLLPKQDTGELVVLDDEDEELARTVVEDWVDYDGEDFDRESERILKHVLNDMNAEKSFDQLNIMALVTGIFLMHGSFELVSVFSVSFSGWY